MRDNRCFAMRGARFSRKKGKSMKKLKNILCLAVISVMILLAAGCRSAENASRAENTGSMASSAEVYKQKVLTNAQTSQTLTARIKMAVSLDGNDVSVGGTLRMKRDDVVQLSATVLGMEVGRIEFSPEDVLIIDRFNGRYVRAAYDRVSFLRNAGLNFYALQALFWNELFVPGEKSVSTAALRRFKSSVSGEHTLLLLDDAPKLNYQFLTLTESAAINRLTVESKEGASGGKLTWKYGDFTQFNGKSFPTQMSVDVSGVGKNGGFVLTLSKLGNSADWQPHTTPSAKYKECDADALFRSLLGL